MAVEGVEDPFIGAIIAEYRNCVLVAATFNPILDKEESGTKVMDCFLRLLPYVHEVAYIRGIGISWRILFVVGGWR